MLGEVVSVCGMASGMAGHNLGALLGGVLDGMAVDISRINVDVVRLMVFHVVCPV